MLPTFFYKSLGDASRVLVIAKQMIESFALPEESDNSSDSFTRFLFNACTSEPFIFLPNMYYK